MSNTNPTPPDCAALLSDLNAVLAKHNATLSWDPDFPAVSIEGWIFRLHDRFNVVGEPKVLEVVEEPWFRGEGW